MADAWQPPRRRRVYLMRHGAVDYVAPDGRRYASDERPLSAAGREQALAAGRFLAGAGVRPDRVAASTLPRTVQTAAAVLEAIGADLAIERHEALREIASGRVADIPEADLEREYAQAFVGVIPDQRRYLGGETFGALVDRVLPALHGIVHGPGWDTLLLVLHGAVNRAVLSHALTGGRVYLGNFQQSFACINVLDVGEPGDWVVRAVNLAPTDPAHVRTRATSMEEQFARHLATRG